MTLPSRGRILLRRNARRSRPSKPAPAEKLMPGFSRASTAINRALRSDSASFSALSEIARELSGRYMPGSVIICVPQNSLGATPIMLADRPFSANLLADDCRVARESLLPVRICKHHHRLPSRLILFVRLNQTAEPWLHAEDREIVAGHETAQDLIGFVVRAQAAECPACSRTSRRTKWTVCGNPRTRDRKRNSQASNPPSVGQLARQSVQGWGRARDEAENHSRSGR